MFRFTIRDVLWLMVVVGLSTALYLQRQDLNKCRESAALKQIRLEAVASLMNEYGYRIVWSNEYSPHGPFNTYPHPVRVGPAAHHEQDIPKP